MRTTARIACSSLLLGLLSLAGAAANAAKAADADPPLVNAADAARRSNQLDEAERLYRQALAAAPESDGAHRGLCLTLVQLQDQRDAGLAECKRALAHSGSPANRAAYAIALITGEHSSADLDRASAFASSAVGDASEDPSAILAMCRVLLDRGDKTHFEVYARRLARFADSVEGSVYAIWLAIDAEDVPSARAALERAAKLGLGGEELAKLQQQVNQLAWRVNLDTARHERALEAAARPGWTISIWSYAGAAAAAWLALLTLLFVVGWTLSALTLRQVAGNAGRLRAEPSPGERQLRAVYRAVVAVCALVFYLTVPLALFAVVGLGGGALWAIFQSDRIPVRLTVGLVLVMGATVSIIVRSLFARDSDDDLGLGLEPARQPRLAAILEEVAREVGTRPIDMIFLRRGADLAVFERGGILGTLRGHRQRCLFLGIGLLDGMTLEMFRSVLAHEYGHFRNQDTAGGSLALRVAHSLDLMIQRMGSVGRQRVLNPAWWFLRGFELVFVRVTRGARRLQEVLADRAAAIAYGSDAFVRGFCHVIERDAHFTLHVDAVVREAEAARRPLENVYRYRAQIEDTPEFTRAVEVLAELAIVREPQATDSHPSARQRIAWARSLGAPARQHTGDRDPVWGLFSDQEAIERRLTAMLRDDLAIHHNIVFPPARPGQSP